MENEFQKMQRLAGVSVTEDKKQLDENFVGTPMVGNIFDRPKADYELAYEHYLGQLDEKKASAGTTAKERSSVAKKAHAGKDIGKKGKGFEKVAKTAAKEYGSKEAGTKVAAAAMWKNLKEEEGADGEENPIDAITMDIPLFIRMLEFAREDASTDMDLHDVAEKATALSAEGEILSMDNYEDIVGGEANIKEGISSFLNRVEKSTRMLSDVMSIVLMAKQDGEGDADKAVQMMMDKYGVSQEEALQAVTDILKKFERFI